MSERTTIQARAPAQQSQGPQPVLPRRCDCGRDKGPSGLCPDCRSKGLGIQAKLTVNKPGDRYEQEADRVAETVMRDTGQFNRSALGQPEEVLQRQALVADEEEEEETLQASEKPGQQPALSDEAAAQIEQVKNGGQPLPAEARRFFEPRFGHDFDRVRVHAGPQAAQAAQSVSARAFTLGNHIVFGAGEYSPATTNGQRLLAHELTHVVQQGGQQARIARAAGEARYEKGERRLPAQVKVVAGEEDMTDIQRQLDGVVGAETPAAEPAEGPVDGLVDGPAAPAAPAAPTLTLTPGNQLVRGSSLTAAISFTPNAGETLTVSGWSYVTTDHGTIDRPAADADFQTRWAGTMALSGTLRLRYRVTPAGGTPGSEQTLDQAITVTDRSGAPWASTITDEVEAAFGGQPSPPTAFIQLGRHNIPSPTLPNPTTSQISSGPNKDLTYISSLTAGTFISRPRIHPDVTNDQSNFRQFHLEASVLFFVPTNGAKRRIPNSDYSNLVETPLSFSVPDWEAFYKAQHFYTVTATAGSTTVTLQNGWWRLNPNAEDGSVEIADEPAVRQALGIDQTVGYSFTARPNGSWEGNTLMPSAQIPVGTRSHEYVHNTHSHRANYHAMMRALDPQRKIEKTISSTGNTVDFNAKIQTWWNEISEPDHELVDEAASRTQEEFVALAGQTMAGVNTDPATGNFLGNVWNITGNAPMA